MNIIFALTLILVTTTIAIGVYAIFREINGKKLKRFLGLNFASFIALLIGATIFLLSGDSAEAAETATEAAAAGESMKYIAAALATGIGAIGAGIAVAVTGSAAIGAISEEPKLFGKTILYVGLAEGIAIYGFIISIMILG
ncbi:MAG: ATP synthase subunit C [Eubacteriales bacterium]